MRRGQRLSVSLPGLALVLGFLVPGTAQGQVTWQDLVFTGGLSAEAYRGNLAAVTVTAVDSTNEASAMVGEFGVRGGLSLFNRNERTVSLQFDGGLRQSVAQGFLIRDYAPREWVGMVDLGYRGPLGSLGVLSALGGVSSRWVDDRPPMPMFLQPGYKTANGRIHLQLYQIDGIYYDARVYGEKARYSTTSVTQQLELLDRQVLGTEVGAAVGESGAFRLYAGFRATEYENQGTFDPGDPFRRDKALILGGTWTRRSRIYAEIGVEGTFNRSNSSRPEYDALSVRSLVSVPLPGEMSLNFFAVLTAKSYATDTESAQLVPGEEADNASTAYLELSKPLMRNLDGAVRFGWNRAEEDIGSSYYDRYGATFLLRYRPFQ